MRFRVSAACIHILGLALTFDKSGASFNNFLDALDGTFCTFEGGDDPTQDGIYPDPYGGYQGRNLILEEETNCS